MAPVVATQTDSVSYLVLLAGPATTGEEVLVQQLELILRNQELRRPDPRSPGAATTDPGAVRTGEGWDEIRARVEEELRAAIEGLHEAQRQALGNVDEFVRNTAEEQIAGVDLVPLLRRVRPRPYPQRSRRACAGPVRRAGPAGAGGSQRRGHAPSPGRGRAGGLQVEVIPSANHLFQAAVTGDIGSMLCSPGSSRPACWT